MIKYLWKLLFGDSCPHQWQIISQNTKITSHNNHSSSMSYPYNQKVILMTCSKCGKLKKEIV